MLTLYPYADLGHADHGWLNARNHFSFADYHNRKRMHFGVLRVINDDIVASGSGFGMHPHNDMEIITYVREGSISHRDNMGNEGLTAAGDVQVMSAGTGVYHSEHNHSQDTLRLYQIWIFPDKRSVPPRWEQRSFPKEPVADRLHLLVSGREEDKDSGALFIHQDAAISGGNLAAGTKITHPVKHMAYVLASKGTLFVNGLMMQQGDGLEASDTAALVIEASTDCEVLVIDVPDIPA